MEQNHTFSADSISHIRAKMTWAQLELDATKSEEIQVIVAGDDESMEALRVEQTGSGLTVAQPQLAYAKEILPRRRWLQVCLRIPATWRGELDASTVTGTLSAHSLACMDISLTTVSGSMSLRDLRADMLWLHTVSGAVSAAGLTAKRCNLRSVSGQMNLQDASLETTKVFTVSGGIQVSTLPGARSLDAQSVSGAVVVETEGPVRAALHSLSGQLLLNDDLVVSSEGFEINASSLSGDLAVRRKETT